VADELLAGFDRTHAWRDRLRAIGHGRRQDLVPADALAVAAGATPIAALDTDPYVSSGLRVGDAAVVHADDYGRDPIAGTLVAVTRDRVTLARDAGDLGVIHLHVPRVGYVLTRG
jgi:glutathione S-transferase